MPATLIELKNICRSFRLENLEIKVLKNIDLKVESGEFIAIVGTSGSGKSTLMNIIGGLDNPSSGTYSFHHKNVANYTSEQMAKLRRDHFGFIFQRYHLLSTLTALENVEMPAVYAGMPPEMRTKRATSILSALKLKERLDYYPSQLSGGQQQRVSIARALMNGGEIILADEPTGALDSESGKIVLKILNELNARGHTIIMVTHDANVALMAKRMVEIKDGKIISDRINHKRDQTQKAVYKRRRFDQIGKFALYCQQTLNSFKMALTSMAMQRMRTLLTMLGIVIGIASVVLVVAIGKGTSEKILSNIRDLGTSTLTIYPGSGSGDRRSHRVRTLRQSDVEVIENLSYVHSVTPFIATVVGVRYQNLAEIEANVLGVSHQYFNVHGYDISEGVTFDKTGEDRLALDAVIDINTRERLFPPHVSPIGEVIMLDHLPVRIIGVATSKADRMRGSNALNILLPYTSVMNRMLRVSHLREIVVRVEDDVSLKLAEKNIHALMKQLHGSEDFYIYNADSIRETREEITRILELLIISIGTMALLAGGVGVMNIMLVTISERTKEIGMRMAVGAQKNDIAQQFLIEAILVCILGGFIGLIVAFVAGKIFISADHHLLGVSFSLSSIVLSFVVSLLVGIVFGYLPAKKASDMVPIEALERA